MSRIKHNWLLILITLSSLFAFTYRLGRDTFQDWDECIYASYTQGMRATHTYLVSIFNGRPLIDKAPMYDWLLIGTIRALGENEFSYRLVSALACTALIASIYIFARRYFNERVALLSAILTLGTSIIISRARLMNTDAVMSLCIFLGIFAWITADREVRRGRIMQYLPYLAGMFLGLGVMVKGLAPLQFVIALSVAAVVQWRRSSIFNAIKMIAAFVVTIAPWHIAAYVAYGSFFYNQYFIDNIVKRSMHPIEFHHERWYFYLNLIWHEYSPWLLFGLIGPLVVLTRIKSYMNISTLRHKLTQHRVIITIAILIVLPLISMSRVKTRLSWYAMPIVPLISIYIAYNIDVFIRRYAESYMSGSYRRVLISLITITFVFVLSLNAVTKIAREVRFSEAIGPVSTRNEVAQESAKYRDKTLNYLVPASERQAKEILPPEETLPQTFQYGGSACTVYYSHKHVNFYYTIAEFMQQIKTQPGLYMIEKADVSLIDSIETKKLLFKNADYSLFSI